MSKPHTALEHLSPAWFSIVMGLGGLALAWDAAVPMLGAFSHDVSMGIGVLAALVLLLLLIASVWRVLNHPEAVKADWHHPVRHPFVATLPISLMLIATVGAAHGAPRDFLQGLWWSGSLLQWVATIAVLSRWWSGNGPSGFTWAGITPVLFIPIVGNVLAPLGGLGLGHPGWATAQFGVGLVFWPLVLALLGARVASQGLWPERLLPSAFIILAPPTLAGLAAGKLGAPPWLAWMAWGAALASLAWAAMLLPRILALPFGLPHWAMSFPLAAFAGLSLQVAGGGDAFMRVFALLALGLASLVIVALLGGTVRGLWQGQLLTPEMVPSAASAGP